MILFTQYKQVMIIKIIQKTHKIYQIQIRKTIIP